MASFTFKPHHHQQAQLQLSSFSHCKYSSILNIFKFHFSLAEKRTLQLLVKARVVSHLDTRLSKDDKAVKNVHSRPKDDYNSGSFSFPSINGSAGRKISERGEEPIERRVILRDRNAKNKLNSRRTEAESKDKSLVKINSEKKTKSWKEGGENKDVRVLVSGKKNKQKRTKNSKADSPELTLRVGLDLCSKRGDVVGAIKLYELARKEDIKMGQYHFAVLLYLCSSAATGTVQPAKSGSSTRILSTGDPLKENSVVGSDPMSEFGKMEKRNEEELFTSSLYGSMMVSPQTLDGLIQELKKNAEWSRKAREGGNEICEIQISEDVKRLALHKGFEIYNEMRIEKVPMNEAIFTSVARMAMAFEDGDMAFDMVKQMKEYGINPRLRSYGPALAIFCNKGDVDKAFMVEKHMLAHGVYPEEPELEALLKVSIEAKKSDKVYYVMHKLRTSVRQVSPVTADVIESWFQSKTASRVGKRKWDQEMIAKAIVHGGGGWHGKGWLGSGKWMVSRSPVGSDGFCKSCNEKIVTIDLDPEETEKFAQSVADLASQREKHSSFQKFQKWLDYYGPFEAVVDGANIGMYSQRTFKPSKVNAVVNGIRQMIPSRKWPLIILHNRRITGEKMEEPFNKSLIEKWKNADAVYATPTGSNDDWYWLYAAIKCKCLLVTNDEMRDHLFQLLGNDFFPKWKERHQVHFSFTETGPEFHMPPPCSVVIQESEKGHWHIPIASEVEHEDQRIWLCCTRADISSLTPQDSADLKEDSHLSRKKNGEARRKKNVKLKLARDESHDLISKQESQELASNIKTVIASSISENNHSILPEIDAAEKLGSCLIDFQI